MANFLHIPLAMIHLAGIKPRAPFTKPTRPPAQREAEAADLADLRRRVEALERQKTARPAAAKKPRQDFSHLRNVRLDGPLIITPK